MSDHEWIVCETSGRWAVALRVAIARSPNLRMATPSLRETRSLSQLAARLAERPRSLALVEVSLANLHDVLALLADARSSYPQTRFISLVAEADGIDVLSDLTRAAGAIDAIHSPRYLQPLLSIGQRFADDVPRADILEQQSFAERAWGMLPWQDRKRPIG